MASYEEFAQIYDWALNELPYETWLSYIETIFKRFEAKPKVVLDLGCGTGTITNLMASKGYEMIAVDLSEDMLAIAKGKAKESDQEVIYLNQNMTELDLYGTVDAVISCGDSLNYVLDEKDLLAAFKHVNNFLNPGGLFVFDMNSIYKFKEALGNRTYAENHEDYAYIWENYFYEEESINEYEVTIFIKNATGSFDKATEIHHERGYEIEHIKRLLDQSGLKLEAIYNDNTFEPATAMTERIYYVAREQGKE